MVRNFIDNFLEEADYAESLRQPVQADMAVGEAMYPTMCDVISKANDKLGGKLHIHVHKIVNNFFGGNVWVTGLITATDLIDQLKGKLKTDRLLLCEDMLRSEKDMFLDDMTPQDVVNRLGVTTEFYPNDGLALAQRLFNTEY